jgi:hypothetical protein
MHHVRFKKGPTERNAKMKAILAMTYLEQIRR